MHAGVVDLPGLHADIVVSADDDVHARQLGAQCLHHGLEVASVERNGNAMVSRLVDAGPSGEALDHAQLRGSFSDGEVAAVDLAAREIPLLVRVMNWRERRTPSDLRAGMTSAPSQFMPAMVRSPRKMRAPCAAMPFFDRYGCSVAGEHASQISCARLAASSYPCLRASSALRCASSMRCWRLKICSDVGSVVLTSRCQICFSPDLKSPTTPPSPSAKSSAQPASSPRSAVRAEANDATGLDALRWIEAQRSDELIEVHHSLGPRLKNCCCWFTGLRGAATSQRR
jgi:hypothetical protein